MNYLAWRNAGLWLGVWVNCRRRMSFVSRDVEHTSDGPMPITETLEPPSFVCSMLSRWERGDWPKSLEYGWALEWGGDGGMGHWNPRRGAVDGELGRCGGEALGRRGRRMVGWVTDSGGVSLPLLTRWSTGCDL